MKRSEILLSYDVFLALGIWAGLEYKDLCVKSEEFKQDFKSSCDYK